MPSQGKSILSAEPHMSKIFLIANRVWSIQQPTRPAFWHRPIVSLSTIGILEDSLFQAQGTMEILEWEVLQNLFAEPLWSFERLWILARTHASPLVQALATNLRQAARHV